MAQVTEPQKMQPTDTPSAESLFDFVGILWRRKWIGLVVFVVCLAMGGLYFSRATREYTSTAQILLVKKEKIPVATSQQGAAPGRYTEYGYEDTVSTHMLLICSPLIVGKAVELNGLASLPSMRPDSDDSTVEADPQAVTNQITKTIIKKLTAKRAGEKSAPDPNVMSLSIEGTDPHDCATVLSAIIESYQKFLGETYQNFGAETLVLITEAKDVLSQQLNEKESAYSEFRQESPSFIWQGQGKDRVPLSLPDLRISEIEKARSAFMLEMASTQALQEGVQAALKRNANREAVAMLVRNSQRNRSGMDLQGQTELMLLQNMLGEQEALEAYGPDHPKVKSARSKMTALREQVATTASPDNSDTSDFLKRYVESLVEEVQVGQQRLVQLDKLLDAERQSAKEVMVSQLKEEHMRADLNRTQQTFEAVIKRLQEIDLLKDYGGITMQLLSQPQEGTLVRPRAKIVFAMAVLLGLGLGAGAAYLVELADRSFRDPEDLRLELGLPILGHVPVIHDRGDKEAAAQGGDGKPGLTPNLCTYHQPKEQPAEAYRAIRTAIYFGTGGESHKVIQVTSPGPGDGKTTMASNLAIAIADSGKKVLIVDADLRRPKIGKYFGLDESTGMSTLFAGEAELSDVVQETLVQNLWAIPCGPRPPNPADLLTSTQFKEFVALVREKYDFVIIDSPPVLAVTDPAAIAPRVDGVVFVLRLSKHSRETAARSIELINSVGGRILGLVVNAVSDGKTGYGYGTYGYRGYGYGRYRYGGYGKHGYGKQGYGSQGYGYGYGYGYGDTDQDANGDSDGSVSRDGKSANGRSNGHGVGDDAHGRLVDGSSKPDSTKGIGRV